jgi:hypothetical protein
MIWYAVEILFVLGLSVSGVMLYTYLVRSPAFARFLNRLTVTPEEQAEERLDIVRKDTATILAEAREDIKEKAARAARLKKKL